MQGYVLKCHPPPVRSRSVDHDFFLEGNSGRVDFKVKSSSLCRKMLLSELQIFSTSRCILSSCDLGKKIDRYEIEFMLTACLLSAASPYRITIFERAGERGRDFVTGEFSLIRKYA